MADEDEGHARITAQGLQQFDHIRPGQWRRAPMSPRRTIHLRVCRERARQIDPLLLAARQFMWVTLGKAAAVPPSPEVREAACFSPPRSAHHRIQAACQ